MPTWPSAYPACERQINHVDGMCNSAATGAVFCPYSGRPYKDKFHALLGHGDFKRRNEGLPACEGGMLVQWMPMRAPSMWTTSPLRPARRSVRPSSQCGTPIRTYLANACVQSLHRHGKGGHAGCVFPERRDGNM